MFVVYVLLSTIFALIVVGRPRAVEQWTLLMLILGLNMAVRLSLDMVLTAHGRSFELGIGLMFLFESALVLCI